MSAEDLDRSRKRKQRNYVRVEIAMYHVKYGIQQFIKTQIHQQHLGFVQKLTGSRAHITISCNSCTSENLLPDQHNHNQQDRCSRYSFCKDKTSNRRQCPNNLCGRLYDEIVKAHVDKNPFWSNTDASKWFDEEWEIAKCFIGSGYKRVHSADGTDMTGLISIAINNTFIRNKMNTKVEDLKEIKTIRNSIMHSGELNEQQVHDYIGKMISFLENERAFNEFVEAKEACKKLKELDDDKQFLVTMREELGLKTPDLTKYILELKNILQALENNDLSHEFDDASGSFLSGEPDSQPVVQASQLKLQGLPNCISEKEQNSTTNLQKMEDTTLNDLSTSDLNSQSSSDVVMRPRANCSNEMRLLQKKHRRNFIYQKELRQQDFDRQQKATSL